MSNLSLRRYFLVPGLLTLLLSSCRKDPQVKPFEPYDPTPVELDIPEFALSYLGAPENPVNNLLTEEGIALGRRLFYEPMLSDTRTVTCASCHDQSANFSDPNQFSTGTSGELGDRNSMVLANLNWDNFLFWDGRRSKLEDQAHDPVVNPVEMNTSWDVVVDRLQAHPEYPLLFYKAFGSATIDSIDVMRALAQFERSLISFNSPFDRYHFLGDTTALTPSQRNGYNLYFGHARCFICHGGPLLSDGSMSNNGLDATFTDLGYGKTTNDPNFNGKFKMPSLRNIAQSAPYMHDGRLQTLEEVVDFYNDGVHSDSPNIDNKMFAYLGGLGLDASEKADLINFLKALTDADFLLNPTHSDPN